MHNERITFSYQITNKQLLNLKLKPRKMLLVMVLVSRWQLCGSPEHLSNGNLNKLFNIDWNAEDTCNFVHVLRKYM